MFNNSDVLLTQQRRRLNRVGIMASDAVPPAGSKGIASRLIMRRLQLHMTQLQVAKSVEFSPRSGLKRDKAKRLSRNTYAMYETGKSEPNLDVLEKIAIALQAPAGWIAFGEGTAPIGLASVGPDIGITQKEIVLKISVECPAAIGL